MSRILVAIATLVVVVTIGVTIWMSSHTPEAPAGASENSAPRQFDTKGGQEMRSRWNNSGGQGDDTADN